MAHRLLWMLVLILLAVVSGCKPVVPHSPTLERYALLKLVFPDWVGTDPMIQPVDLSALRKRTTSAEIGGQRAEILPLYVVKLDDTHAVLITKNMPVDSGGNSLDCHACSVFVGAYFFTRDDDGWRLTGRQHGATASGVEGEIGKTGIARLGEAHYAFFSEWGSCWQGFCGSWLEVISLRPDKASAATLPSSVDNDGAFGACSALDGKGALVPEGFSQECQQITGTWQFKGERLTGDFRGRLSASGQGVRKIRQQAVYHFVEGLPLLERGENPVPSF